MSRAIGLDLLHGSVLRYRAEDKWWRRWGVVFELRWVLFIHFYDEYRPKFVVIVLRGERITVGMIGGEC